MYWIEENAGKVIGVIVVVVVLLMVLFTNFSNYDYWDTTYSFDEAIIALADGTIVHGKVENWRDYEDGDQIQVKVNGATYLVHAINITLIAH